MFKKISSSNSLFPLEEEKEGTLEEEKKHQILSLLKKLHSQVRQDRIKSLSFDFNKVLDEKLGFETSVCFEVPSNTCNKDTFYATSRGIVFIEEVKPKDDTIDLVTVSLELKDG